MDIGGGIQLDVSSTGAGSGNYQAFLRLQNNGTEEGYNTDDKKVLDNVDGNFTHSLLLSAMQSIVVNNVSYYEIRLDINESGTGGNPISLDELQLFGSATAATKNTTLSSLHKVFDLGAAVQLVDQPSGSGLDDYRLLVPTSLFSSSDVYFTLYSRFSGADAGFEEWRVLGGAAAEAPPAITVVKDVAPTTVNEGGVASVTYTYTVTSQSAATDPLTVTLRDDNATPGNTGDDFAPTYVSGDADNDGKLDSNETWIYTATRSIPAMNAGATRTNIVTATGVDDEGIAATDTDDAVVTAVNRNPAITIVKTAVPTTIAEGAAASVVYGYAVTSQSASTDPLTLSAFVDDNGTPGTPGDDVNLLSGFVAGSNHGTAYVSGDIDNDYKLDSNETWLFSSTRTVPSLNAGGTWTNIVTVTGTDDENNSVTDTDTATVTGTNVNPAITIDKVASVSSIQSGVSTPVTFTYTINNTSTAATDPLTLLTLVDNMGTADTGDDVNLLTGYVTNSSHGNYYVGGDADGDYLVDKGETWSFSLTTNLLLSAGELRTNVVTVTAQDDDNTPLTGSDDASVYGANWGHTPGFWVNNGSLIWDGNGDTFPKNNSWVGMVAAGADLAYGIHDLNGDGVIAGSGESAVDNNPTTGNRGYLMIGDWDKDGFADANENVLVISRSDALTFLDASQKQQQDGRYQLARDVVASWLNYLGGSDVGASNQAKSAMHYIDEATAWLMRTTDGNHVLTVSELGIGKVGQSTDPWSKGYDYSGNNVVTNMLPAAGEHDLGPGTGLDILAGSVIHTGLDYYNNTGLIL